MRDLVGTGIDVAEARRRLAARCRDWPRWGYNFSNTPGYTVSWTTDGFVVRGLPRLLGAPIMEASGRWRDTGGVDLTYRSMLRAYLPSIVLNSLLPPLVFLLAVVAAQAPSGWPRDVDWQIIGRVAIPVIVVLFINGLVIQAVVFLGLLARRRGREREALHALLRDTLGA